MSILTKTARIALSALLIAAIGAPAAKAGHEDVGPRRALRMIHPGANPHSQDVAALQRSSAPGQAVASSSGFDWSDAGVGAAASIGLLLLAGGVTVTVRHGRGRLTAS